VIVVDVVEVAGVQVVAVIVVGDLRMTAARTVRVGMAVVDVVQAAVDQIIHVVAVGDHLVATVFAVVAAAGDGFVLVGIFIRDRDFTFVPVSVVLMV
jgi:hypothetical protein